MTHEETRAWMRAAPRAELRSPPASVRAHAAGCPDCAAALATLTRGLDLLAAQRDALRPPMGPEEAVRLAVSGRPGSPAAGPAATPRPGRRTGIPRRWALVPASALAAIVVALLWPDAEPSQPAPTASSDDASEPALAVRVADDERVAVFATPNPRIHVVWLIDGRTPNGSGR